MEEPQDPFAGAGPVDAELMEQLRALDAELGDEDSELLDPADREDVVHDLGDLEVFRALLEHRGVRGLVVDCGDCQEAHYFDWALLLANLRHLLDHGRNRVHEPAVNPDPGEYVSWEYARGFADGTSEASEAAPE